MDGLVSIITQMESVALVLTTIGLAVVWTSYQRQLKYQREQDKDNIKMLMEINVVLDKVQEAAKEQNSQIFKEIRQQSELTREHINVVISKLYSNGSR